jgi:Tol biopolymer transport system component
MRFASFLRSTLAMFAVLALLPVSAALAQVGQAQPGQAQAGEDIAFPLVTSTQKPVTYIAIPNFGPGGISDIIYNDLELFSDFARVPKQDFVEQTAQRDASVGGVDYAEWQRLNANFVLKGKITAGSGTLSADCFLYDVDNKRNVFSLRYTDFPASNPRKLAHRVSDDIVKYVFNKVGIASTQIACCGLGVSLTVTSVITARRPSEPLINASRS